MTTPDDHQAGNTEPSIPAHRLSRRLVLKAVGATALATAATTLPVPWLGSPLSAAPAVPTSTLETALQVAIADPMFRDALQTAEIFEFGFEPSVNIVRQASINGVYVGLVLPHSRSESPRTGADLVLTVDLVAKRLTTAQSIIGQCLVDMFLITSTLFDVRYEPYEELRSERVQYSEPPELIRPRFQQQWSQPQPDVRPLKPEEFVNFGWPPESPSECYWHYQGCGATEWIADRDLLIYRGTHVTQQKSCQPDRQITVDLRYASEMH